MYFLISVHHYIQSSIRRKMLLYFSLIITSSVIFVTYLSITTYSHRLESNNIEHSQQLLNNYQRNIANNLDEIDRVIKSVTYDYNVQRYLIHHSNISSIFSSASAITTDKTDYYLASMELLYTIISLRPEIQSIFIHGDNKIFLQKSRQRNLNQTAIINYANTYSLGSDMNYRYVLNTNTYYNDQMPFFTVMTPINRYDGQVLLGTLQIDIQLSFFQRLADSMTVNSQTALILIAPNQNVLYMSSHTSLANYALPSSEEIANTLSQYIDTSISSNYYFIAPFQQEDYHIVYSPIDTTGWALATLTPYSLIIREAKELQNTIIIICALSLLIILLFTYVLASRMTYPIRLLKESMNRTDYSHFDSLVDVHSSDEIGDLSASFNQMLLRIKFLMEQVVNEQEEKRIAEIQVLQDQINPHFLYNTLDTIIWMSEVHDPNTVPMIEALSNLFRLSLNKGQEFITLSNEFEQIKNYLYILSLRYKNKFDYKLMADSHVSDFKIPKLILQPLVENAIYHGIKPSNKKGILEIRAIARAQIIQIFISDNGIGMCDETCQQLISNCHSNSNTPALGVGVKNVHQRIQLYYGPEYGLQYISKEGNGTTVTITLPTYEK